MATVMRRYIERVGDGDDGGGDGDDVTVDDSVTLTFQQRCKTRLRVTLDATGVDAGIQLPRGLVLRDGDVLRSDDAHAIRIIAADEKVSTVRVGDGDVPGDGGDDGGIHPRHPRSPHSRHPRSPLSGGGDGDASGDGNNGTGSMALARAAYHLGNRHLAVQIGPGWLRYLADHVIDDMLRAHGFCITHEHAPFDAEGGAYSIGGGHGHSHGDGDRHGDGDGRGDGDGHGHHHRA